MEMAKVKLSQLAEHGELLDRYGASVRVLGQRDLVRPDVLESIERAVDMTKHNGDAVLNVCFPYTSRDEITTAIRETVVEYSKPIARSSSTTSNSRNPFSQKHIEHNLRSQQLSSEPETTTTPSTSPERQQQQRNTRSPSASSATSDSYEPSNNDSTTSSITTLNNDHEQNLSDNNTDTLLKPQPPTSFPSKTRCPLPRPSSYPSPESITPSTLTSHTFTSSDPPLDILIRTSGVHRLSDFMLWQCHQDTDIVFLETLWPEFDLWAFLPVLWYVFFRFPSLFFH